MLTTGTHQYLNRLKFVKASNYVIFKTLFITFKGTFTSRHRTNFKPAEVIFFTSFHENSANSHHFLFENLHGIGLKNYKNIISHISCKITTGISA